jgi:hypothetical protein
MLGARGRQTSRHLHGPRASININEHSIHIQIAQVRCILLATSTTATTSHRLVSSYYYHLHRPGVNARVHALALAESRGRRTVPGHFRLRTGPPPSLSSIIDGSMDARLHYFDALI